MSKYNSREEYLQAIQSLVGDRSDDNALEIIGNLTDTYNDLSIDSGENWKQKYEDNDKEWRRKYKERFFSGGSADSEPDLTDPTPTPKKLTFSDLFKEGV